MSGRSILLILMVGLAASAVFNAAYFGIELKRFVDATPRLQSSRDLERYKSVVGRQMIAALAQIVLLATPPLLYAIGLMMDVLVPTDFVFVLVPSLVILAVAGVYRKSEKSAKEILAADPELERQRDAIVHTWLRKPWPDW
jgi:hypothetical protein